MSTREQKLEAIFADVLARPPAEHDTFLVQVCGCDEVLRDRVRRLLRAHMAAGEFLASPLAGPPGDIAPGTQIGRYRLIEKIGEGGVGVVFKAEQSEPFRRVVALKLIKPGMDTREIIGRFESERQALALMDHPGIARVFDAGATAGGRPYFVLELVPGWPITRFCDEHRLVVAARLELFAKICRAIHHAHTRGIIHRDIKPANILVTWQDGAPAPKVIDFGIAKATEARLTDKTVLTALLHVIGTPAYVSPEQLALAADIDRRSDVYSLGALLYELVTGNTPFDRAALAQDGIDAWRRRVREDAPPRPAAYLDALDAETAGVVATQRQTTVPELVATIRGGLEWIVMRCLEKDRERRFATAEALADDVGRFLRCESLETAPPSALDRLKTYTRSRAAARWLGATAAAILDGWTATRRSGKPMGDAAIDAEVRAATRGRTRDVEAYRYYQQGRELLDRLTKDDIERAIACFQRASERDDQFALAWVGVALAHESLAKWGDAGAFDASFAAARVAAERALAIEPELAEAHVALAKVQMGHDWDWSAAEKSLRRALSLAPANVHVWVAAAAHAMNLGQRERALELGRRAVELDPGLFAAHQYLTLSQLAFGEIHEAEAGARRMLALSPESELSHWILCVCALERGQHDRALAHARREKDMAFRLMLLAITHHARGETAASDAALHELTRDHETQASYQIAQVHAGRGQNDAAFIWLEWAYRRRDAGLAFAKVDPMLRHLHGDPRWPELLRRLRLTA